MRAALWLRVSTEGQDTANQALALCDYAQRRGLEVVKVYNVHESAWSGDHYHDLAAVYADAQAGSCASCC